ncbi:MAG: sulfurtransferase TusA family protein [Gammaproteobacteria bacterium]
MPETETNNPVKYDQTLDAKGLNCPLPVLKAKLALNKMQAGEILHVEATDPHSTIDFEAYCARTGHEIIHTTEIEDVLEFYIRRTENPKKI